jgi:hypothetical protein
MRLTNIYSYQGTKYEIYYSGISYKCPALKIFGEKTYLTCKNSIARKLKIKASLLTEEQ